MKDTGNLWEQAAGEVEMNEPERAYQLADMAQVSKEVGLKRWDQVKK